MSMISMRETEASRRTELIFTSRPLPRVAALCYGDATAPLTDLLPLKLLPLDGEGRGVYDWSAELVIPGEATHLWALPDLDRAGGISLPLPRDPRATCEVPLFHFYAISDIHLVAGHRSPQSPSHTAWARIAADKPAFVLVAGDIANGVQAVEYELCRQQLEAYLPEVPVLVTFGNHDHHPNHDRDLPDHESREAFRRWLRARNAAMGVVYEDEDDSLYSVSLCGMRILSLQGMDYRDKLYAVGDAALSRLETLLTEYAAERRVVFCHYPLTDGRGRIYLRENVKLTRLLERQGQLLYLAGHTHDSPDSDIPSIRRVGGVTYVNTASVGNTEPCVRDTRVLKALRNAEYFPELERYFCRRSMGLRVEVYDDHMLLCGVDLGQGCEIPRCRFRIELPPV